MWLITVLLIWVLAALLVVLFIRGGSNDRRNR